jgi:hypothetical protein
MLASWILVELALIYLMTAKRQSKSADECRRKTVVLSLFLPPTSAAER